MGVGRRPYAPFRECQCDKYPSFTVSSHRDAMIARRSEPAIEATRLDRRALCGDRRLCPRRRSRCASRGC